MAEVAVVGAGLGGLSSAIHLAARGYSVTVLEAGEGPGGKAGVTHVGGLELDTGPSLLTLPDVFDETLRAAGTSLAEEVTLRELSPAFLYLWPDGTRLALERDPQASLDRVREALGGEAASDLQSFMRYAERIWREAAPRFVRGPAPSLRQLLALSSLRAMAAIDPLRTMAQAIDAQVRSPHLRDVLWRYATYNGSDPRRAPATLSCIAHVDLAEGGLGGEGGVAALVRALVRAGERLGVRYRFGARVQAIEIERSISRSHVRGVRLAGGERVRAAAVVANADVAHVGETLAPKAVARGGPPSMSAYNAIVRAQDDPSRVAHTVLFPSRYEAELADIFDRDRPPREPAVYVCAQARAHARGRFEGGAEPLFVMANCPPEPEHGSRSQDTWHALRARVIERLQKARLIHSGDAIVWERTPADLARRFPGSRGALYGAASISRTSAFVRPPNRARGVRGLYFASGSAHPGGGMPLCVLSGRAAADALCADLGGRALDRARSA
ncbi:MAG: phytoene desaturase [Sandaracinaceae bacterium]|nr:phytoene desaturase [Sandaracinaceae bacterium]